MDLAQEQLQTLSMSEILAESISIPKQSPRTFSLITLTLIFPLSFAIVGHSLFTQPLIQQLHEQTTFAFLQGGDTDTDKQIQHTYTLILTYQFCYLIFLFALSLLSTAAVVFTVASLYTSKRPVSFASTFSAIPPVLKRLFVTFLYVAFFMILYNFAYFISVTITIFIYLNTASIAIFFFSFMVVSLIFLFLHLYITALWHLASVVTVLEPISGIPAMKKSWELLKGKAWMAMTFVFWYFFICAIVGSIFGIVVVNGQGSFGMFVRIVMGGLLVGVLVIVNLIGLLLQSVFYYVCKSYHHQSIDKTALNDHLGGYLGEYVPLKSSIQMESLELTG